jgi:predicted transposase YdaD
MTAPTIFEEGLQRGKIEGKIEGQQESLMLLLEERFAPLDDSVRRRVNELPEAELRRLLRQVVHAKSLADLGLE